MTIGHSGEEARASHHEQAPTTSSDPSSTAEAPTANAEGCEQVGDLHMDGREIGEWKSRYPKEAIAEIRFDAWFVGLVLIATLVMLILVWNGMVYAFVSRTCGNSCSPATFTKFALFFLGGLLGGILFGIKYLYKVVGRGAWNMDRRLWRIFSPFVSGGLALAVGAMIDSGIVGLTTKTSSSSAHLAMGFITGYFADGALAKMQDVADTIFGSGRREPISDSKKK